MEERQFTERYLHPQWKRVANLWVKNESCCPTNTFKDRLAWQYVEAANSGKLPCGNNTILCTITLGNTMRSFAHAVKVGMVEAIRPRLLAIFPSGFSTKTIGPNSQSKVCRGSDIMRYLSNSGVHCTEYALDQGYLNDTEIRQIATRFDSESSCQVINATNGIGIPAYKQILEEALDTLPDAPDLVVVPVGAGILFMECVELIIELGLDTHVIGVAVTTPDSIADKIYSVYSPFHKELLQKGLASYMNANQFAVLSVSDEEIKAVRTCGLPAGFERSEPSSWAPLAPLLTSHPFLTFPYNNVLAINTGDGIS